VTFASVQLFSTAATPNYKYPLDHNELLVWAAMLTDEFKRGIKLVSITEVSSCRKTWRVSVLLAVRGMPSALTASKATAACPQCGHKFYAEPALHRKSLSEPVLARSAVSRAPQPELDCVDR
jgi:hypothetical protein